ncbi:putative f-box domain-containing protein [Botrytis fragariae]|uniref:Putative f-box domain-containing protein n=1 Tax=Botrytis fragariae TaxID=1964551 RepID=A0A8H6AR25_9HELO|nr:putative f-box domain-containing protein [Botrytis fragariae]KAF5871909.1 putative f-box domain-containing protein [Botrytis fragariae]
MDDLPSEIVLNITSYLEPSDIVKLQFVSKRYLELGRDDTLWRDQCFTHSSFLERLRRRQELISTEPEDDSGMRDLAIALATNNGTGDSRLHKPRHEARDLKAQSNERVRILANWDPSYPTEKVKWYDEYIARNAPISTSWVQQPRHRESASHEHLEVRGMALYTPMGETKTTMVVAPLDDGSICIWDISTDAPKKGSIIARSKSGILSVDGQKDLKSRSKMISTGVTECISVDSTLKRAYVAVQSGLVEVDLETLQTVNHERYPFSITALSEAKHPTPLTVGTNLSLYLHDSRQRTNVGSPSQAERLDFFRGTSGSASNHFSFKSLLDPEPSAEYAHLYQPGPLSIVHLPSAGSEWNGNGDIYVAGRFPSILNYDRRNFPKLRGTIHSGARLSQIASLPYPFASMEKDLARRGELSVEQVWQAKTRPGKTLIACGEYNSKGSLEMYGLSPDPNLSNISSQFSAGRLQDSTMKNRQTSSSSKLLSVANHGTRIVVSDGGGNLKWFERDGFTESRRWNIAHGSVEAPRGIFGTLGDSYMDSGSGDIALKILTTDSGLHDQSVNENDLVLWTGDKIGLLNFSNKPGFTADSFEEIPKTAEEALREKEEHTHSETMRRALEMQANEVRYVRGLGMGFV